MLTFLPKYLTALIGILLHALNVIICGVYTFLLAPFKLLLPFKSAQKIVRRFLRFTPRLWSMNNDLIIYLCTKIKWDVQLPEITAQQGSFILISNHQSWNDILINQKIFYRKLPSVVYFLKHQLLWMPILGWTCWLLDFPFMKRYTSKYLAKYPEKRGQDIAAAKASCEKYRDFPVTIVNFPEGTRLTKAKHDAQQSPFVHLLKPRAGGVALALQAMQGQITQIVNVTIIYPEGVLGFWSFLGGDVKKIIVRAELIPVTDDLIGDYLNDEQFREHMQQWFNNLWQAKDKLMSDLQNEVN